jgi:hypothetical protein
LSVPLAISSGVTSQDREHTDHYGSGHEPGLQVGGGDERVDVGIESIDAQ